MSLSSSVARDIRAVLYVFASTVLRARSPVQQIEGIPWAYTPFTKKPEMSAFIWEKLDCKNQPVGGLGAWRAKVPDGWLVPFAVAVVKAAALPPDPKHEWDGGSLP